MKCKRVRAAAKLKAGLEVEDEVISAAGVDASDDRHRMVTGC